MSDKNELMVVNTEYLPELKSSELKEVYVITKNALPKLGLTASCNGKGMYKCVFPDGISGALAKAKDGSGNLGTIINENGIAGQARWIEQAMDPTMMFVAAAMHNIEEKLDELVSITKDMFEFEQIKEESQLTADVDFLIKTLRDYQYNAGNNLWMSSKTSEVVACQNRSKKLIDEYKRLAQNAAKDSGLLDKLVHTDDKANTKLDTAIRYFENYQKAVFLYAFSQFTHILVTEAFEETYLLNVEGDISKLSSEYRDIFSEVSLQLEEYSRGSFDLKALELAGDAAKAIGKLADKTPLISKTSTGDKLADAGDSLESHSLKNIEDKIRKMSMYQKAPVYQFCESINEINNMHHNPIELYYDDENIYLSNLEEKTPYFA